jgi:hypothetical protein
MVSSPGPLRPRQKEKEHATKVADITRLYRQNKHNLDLLRRVVAVEALPEGWRGYFLQRLVQLS